MSFCLGFFRGVEMLAAFVPIAQVCETPDGLSLWEKSEAREAGLTCSCFSLPSDTALPNRRSMDSLFNSSN